MDIIRCIRELDLVIRDMDLWRNSIYKEFGPRDFEFEMLTRLRDRLSNVKYVLQDVDL